MVNAITQQLETARAELGRVTDQISSLERTRDILVARIEAFEISARYIDGMQGQSKARRTSEVKRQRTPSSDWTRIFSELRRLYDNFGYAEVVEVAQMLGVPVKRASLRTKMMNYVNDGHVERIGDGQFAITSRGVEYFNLDAQTNEGPDESEPSSNVGAVAERFIAPDSKSGEPSSSKNDQGSVGSNPTGSAPYSTAHESSLRRDLLMSTAQPPFPSRETG